MLLKEGTKIELQRYLTDLVACCLLQIVSRYIAGCLQITLFSFYKDPVYKDVSLRQPIFKDMVVILLVVISISFPGSDLF